MNRILTVAITCMFAALAVAGCTGNNTPATGGTSTTPTTATGPPSAVASFSPIAPVADQPVKFDASLSQAGGQTISKAEWEFGDGTKDTGITKDHAYNATGDYVARVTVRNAAGLSASNDANLLYVRVAPAATDYTGATANTTAPVASLVGDHQVVKPGDAVSFEMGASHAWKANPNYSPLNATGAGNLPVQPDATAIKEYRLEFGDGQSNTTNTSSAPINHTYAAAGIYAAKLTVTGKNDKTGTAYYSVAVLANPPALSTSPNKDVFVTATITGPTSLDPGYEYDASSGELVQQVYEGLVGYERDDLNKVIPILASEVPSTTNGGISSDGLSYTFKIRPNVQFHDATKVDAAAVKFSLDRLILAKDPNSAALTVVAPIISGAADYINSNGTKADRDAYLAKGGVTVKDAMTVVLKMDSPDPSVFARLSYNAPAIMSPTAFKACHQERVPLWGKCQTDDGLPPPGITRDPWADLHEVGTAAYMVRAWLPNDRVIFDRFDNYWDLANHKSMPKTVIIQFVDDLNTRLLMLKSGQADEIYVNIRDLDSVRPQVSSFSNIVPVQSLVVRQFAFMFNIDPASGECPKDNAGTAQCKFFDDKHIRKTFNYAFDYNAFVTDILHGRATRLHGVVPAGLPGHDDKLSTGYDYDVTKAKSELAASTYKDGFSINIWYNSGNTAREAAANLMKKDLEALSSGIHVNVIKTDFATITAKEQSHSLAVATVGWSPDYIASDDYIVPYYTSTGYFPTSFQYKNTDIDAKVAAALKIKDPTAQAQAYADIEKAAVDDAPYVFLTQDSLVHVERTWVQGYYYNPIDAGIPNVGQYKYISKA